MTETAAPAADAAHPADAAPSADAALAADAVPPHAAPASRAPRPATVAIPGGRAAVSAEVRVPSADRPDEELVCQALDGPDGPLVRIGYARTGRVLRGPVTATPGELADLAEAVGAHAAFGPLLALGGVARAGT